MAHPDDHARQAQEDTPRFAPIRLTCPHCGQPLDVVPVLTAPSAPDARLEAPARSSAGRIGRAALSAMQQRLFPFSAAPRLHHQHAGGAANDRDPVAPRPSGRTQEPIAGVGAANDRDPVAPRPWRTTILVILGIVIIAALLIWFGQPPGGVSETTRPAPAAQPTLATPNAGNLRAQEAALVDTLASYHRAETEAAALLTIEPLLPYLNPTGPFAQRRLAQLAERQRRNAPHRSILVRWGIGAITVDGDTAT
ncbi:MAG: hypothetical protein EOM10_17670, partial [Opitutae bacterium]|nr:hypothetical protein [Opitutae bacterium]